MPTVHFGKLIHTETGKIIMSLIFGLGLASLFRAICKDKNCVIFQAPPLEEIDEKIYKSADNKCYKYVAAYTKCDPKKRIIEFGSGKDDP